MKTIVTILFVCVGIGIYFFTNHAGELQSAILEKPDKFAGQAQSDNVNLAQKSFLGSKSPVQHSSKQNNPFLQTSDANPVAIQENQLMSEIDETLQSPDDKDESIELWVPDMTNELAQNDTIEHEELIKTNPEALANLQVGQVLEFFVPQLGETFQSEIESTSNQLGDVKVWKGNIEGENQEKSNFIMTQGAVMTNVVLATAEGVYTVHINNKTGKGTVIDDREYSSRISDTDDGVPYRHESSTE